MRDDREQQKPMSAEPDQEPELALDKATLKDLEPGASRARQVKGGVPQETRGVTCSCTGGC